MMRVGRFRPAVRGPRPPIVARGLATVNPPLNAHEPWAPPTLDAAATPNGVDRGAVDRRHWAPRGAWDAAALREAQHAHVVGSWGPTSAIASLPLIVDGDGCYLIDEHGKRYLDWTSQAICANLGHSPPPAVKAAIADQLDSVPYLYSGIGMVEVRGGARSRGKDVRTTAQDGRHPLA